MSGIDETLPFHPLNIAVITISDTRDLSQDKSGDLLVQRLSDAGHTLAERHIVPDDFERLCTLFKELGANPGVDIILTTGGTGLTGRDVTPEAVTAVSDKIIDGFGELFRWISFSKIGTSTIQSRAIAGVVNGTYLFALPGSTSACRDGWDDILQQQLDARFRPCNFVELIPRLNEPADRPATAAE